jgi:hypothetical protein
VCLLFKENLTRIIFPFFLFPSKMGAEICFAISFLLLLLLVKMDPRSIERERERENGR